MRVGLASIPAPLTGHRPVATALSVASLALCATAAAAGSPATNDVLWDYDTGG